MSIIFCEGKTFRAVRGLFRNPEVNLVDTPADQVKRYINREVTLLTQELMQAAEPRALTAMASCRENMINMAKWIEDLPEDYEFPAIRELSLRDAFELLHSSNQKARIAANEELKRCRFHLDAAPAAVFPPVQSTLKCERIAALNENRFARPLNICNMETFTERFNACTYGLLAGVLNQYTAIVAGGAVNRLTLHNKLEGADVDVFVIAEKKEEAFRRILERIQENATAQGMKMYSTPKASVLCLNFSGTALTIQLVSSDKNTPDSVIYAFDFSHCMIWYDGERRAANAYWWDTAATNIVRYNIHHRTTTSQKRLIKMLWQGYEIENTFHLKHRFNIEGVIEALNNQSVESVVDEMSATVTLTNNDRENRRLLQLINGGTTKYQADDAIKVMELNSDFTLYSCAAWQHDKIATLLADQFIIPRPNAPYVAATNGKPLVFMFHDCTVREINAADRIMVAECPAGIEFARYIERSAAALYTGQPAINSAVRGRDILISYREGGWSATKWVTSARGDEVAIQRPDPPFNVRVIKFIVRFFEQNYTLVAQSVHIR